MSKIKLCPYCQKVYFDLDQEKCPFCGKKEEEFNPFREIFEDDNPFDKFGVT